MATIEEDYIKHVREMENSGTMKVRVTSKDGEAWYDNRVGEIFLVYKKPTDYRGGLGYKCVDILGGITMNNCEIVD